MLDIVENILIEEQTNYMIGPNICNFIIFEHKNCRTQHFMFYINLFALLSLYFLIASNTDWGERYGGGEKWGSV